MREEYLTRSSPRLYCRDTFCLVASPSFSDRYTHTGCPASILDLESNVEFKGHASGMLKYLPIVIALWREQWLPINMKAI